MYQQISSIVLNELLMNGNIRRYAVMLHCWDADPQRRPDFRQLTEVFENMITDEVEYLEVRSLIVTNRTYFGDNLVPAPTQFRDERRAGEQWLRLGGGATSSAGQHQRHSSGQWSSSGASSGHRHEGRGMDIKTIDGSR